MLRAKRGRGGALVVLRGEASPEKTARIESGIGPHESVWMPTRSMPSGRIACGGREG